VCEGNHLSQKKIKEYPNTFSNKLLPRFIDKAIHGQTEIQRLGKGLENASTYQTAIVFSTADLTHEPLHEVLATVAGQHKH
jgi:hypothetical protein